MIKYFVVTSWTQGLKWRNITVIFPHFLHMYSSLFVTAFQPFLIVYHRMRDLSNQEKQEASRTQKLMDKQHNEINNMTKDKETLEQEVKQLQEQVLELKEQVGHPVQRLNQCIQILDPKEEVGHQAQRSNNCRNRS